MSHTPYFSLAEHPRHVRWFMAVAWALISVKCVLVWWAINHWNVPIHPLWIIVPTLMFAALATLLWLAHHEA